MPHLFVKYSKEVLLTAATRLSVFKDTLLAASQHFTELREVLRIFE